MGITVVGDGVCKYISYMGLRGLCKQMYGNGFVLLQGIGWKPFRILPSFFTVNVELQ